ncbi:MAG: hypothetical protein D6790_03870 [Caldilineae bacterium]|nr:MAG: hypothetical protein D6790_03870 [Caldilineae bacterium]
MPVGIVIYKLNTIDTFQMTRMSPIQSIISQMYMCEQSASSVLKHFLEVIECWHTRRTPIDFLLELP